MWGPLVSAAAGLGLVVFAAEQIVKGTLGLARGLGASTFVIAVVFLGFDPENLAAGAASSAQGTAGIAAATIVGSAMVAIALALGVTALVAPVRFGQVPRRVLAVPLATLALFTLLAAGGRLTRADGAVLVVGYLPVAAAPVTLLCLLLAATRRLPRWAGAALVIVYAGFLIGGLVLYGTAASG
jgi:Ca2+/Na+ antiporter